MSVFWVCFGDFLVGFVQVLVDVLFVVGVEFVVLFEQYGFDQWCLVEFGVCLLIFCYMCFGYVVIQFSGDFVFGLQMGCLSCFGQMGLVGVSVVQVFNLCVVVWVMIYLELFYVQNYWGQLSLVEDVGGVWLCFYLISFYNVYNCFVVDLVLVGWISYFGVLVRQLLKVEWVEIEYLVLFWVECYEVFFGCLVEFGVLINQLCLSQVSLVLVNVEYCLSIWSQMLEFCNCELEQLICICSWCECVSCLLGLMFNGCELDFEEIVVCFKLLIWILWCKLVEEGIQFCSIFNDICCDLVMVYICEIDLVFGEIVYLFGFVLVEVFQCVFKCWSGQMFGEFCCVQ